MQDLFVSWVDLGLLGILVVSIVVGLIRGFAFELLSLAGWFVAWFAAIWLGPTLAPHVPFGAPGSSLNLGLGYVIVFVLALMACGLAAKAIALLIGATPLRPLDRLLGALFGLARAVVVGLAIATVVSYTAWADSKGWRESIGAIWLNAALREVIGVVSPGSALPPGLRPADRAASSVA